MKSDLVEIAGEIRHETERAWLFFDGCELFWLPKSQVEMEPGEGRRATAMMPEWLAVEKGLL